MGEYVEVWFTLDDLAHVPADVQRVGCLVLVLQERHSAWRGYQVREVWLPYRLACAVTGLLRCQVQRAARRLAGQEPGPETAMAAAA